MNNPKKIDTEELFNQLFSHQALVDVFLEKFRNSTGKGVDRINGFQFSMRAIKELSTASTKCLSGTYRFSPYLEVLKTKGRNKKPRIIGIPTIRDRVILSQLNTFLATIYPECVPKNVAATYVREITKDLKSYSPRTTWICTTDIETFYDSIQRDRLIDVIAKKIEHQPAILLVKHALLTPTVPKNTSRKNHSEFKVNVGVPQGLAISNILASIYMQPIDDAMNQFSGITYYRYVDDVIMYGKQKYVRSAFASLRRRLKLRGLGLHSLKSGKSQIAKLGNPFSYLGYSFEKNLITVRDSTIERFLQSIAAKFSDFNHNKEKRLNKLNYLSLDRLKSIFIMELNERITGAIKGNRRYGWIAYFSQIDDLSLLYRLDHTIRTLFGRLDDFGNDAPTALKSLSRAYWEMKFNPEGGYIRNYDEFTSVEQKLEFLVLRGRVNEKEPKLSNEQIEARFDSYVRYTLATMHADEGGIYG